MMTRPFLLIIAIAIFISFFRLGNATLFDVDEAVFAEASREMVESGDWITPTYNGANRYDKPILFYWLMSASYGVFGINEFGARFPSALASLLLILSIFLFVRHCRDENSAFFASGSCALSIYFMVYSHAAVTDMTLTLFIAFSLFSFYLSLSDAETQTRRNIYTYGFYLFSSLAFLTKGLIGIVFPFGIAVLYLFFSEGWRGIRKVFSLKGAALFFAVSAPWYIAQYAINGQEFIDQFFIKHHFKRYTDVISGHKGPYYYYILVLIIGMFPWIAFLPAGIKNTFKRKENLSLFAFVWFAFIFAFFSLSTTKLPNYVLPALPAVTLLIASGMSAQDDKLRRYSLIFMSVVSVVMGAGFIISTKYAFKVNIYDVDWLFLTAAISFTIAILLLYMALWKKTLYGMVSVLMTAFLFMLLVKGLPAANSYLQGTLHRYSLYAKERLLAGEKLLVYGMNNPSLVFYSGHQVKNVNGEDELVSIQRTTGGVFAISKTKDIPVMEKAGFSVLEKDDRYAILEKK